MRILRNNSQSASHLYRQRPYRKLYPISRTAAAMPTFFCSHEPRKSTRSVLEPLLLPREARRSFHTSRTIFSVSRLLICLFRILPPNRKSFGTSIAWPMPTSWELQVSSPFSSSMSKYRAMLPLGSNLASSSSCCRASERFSSSSRQRARRDASPAFSVRSASYRSWRSSTLSAVDALHVGASVVDGAEASSPSPPPPPSFSDAPTGRSSSGRGVNSSRATSISSTLADRASDSLHTSSCCATSSRYSSFACPRASWSASRAASTRASSWALESAGSSTGLLSSASFSSKYRRASSLQYSSSTLNSSTCPRTSPSSLERRL